MNDRQRLEAIISVVGRYLPPDGIQINDAMSEIIGLVDPLPPPPVQEPLAYLSAYELDKFAKVSDFMAATLRKTFGNGRLALYTSPQPAPQPKQEPVVLPFEDKSVISALSWAAELIEQASRSYGGHDGADSWLMNYADKQGERLRLTNHREWEKVNGRWRVKAAEAAHNIKGES